MNFIWNFRINILILGMGFKINKRRYTGNKSKITSWIRNLIKRNCVFVISFCDIFAGTGVVVEALIDDFEKFIINDFLYSNIVIYNTFFGQENYNKDKVFDYFKKYNRLNVEYLEENYISQILW